MNILITGGAGFIGINLVKKLIQDGHKVAVLDNYSIGNKNNNIENVIYYDLDIENIDNLNGENIDLCYHLAALSRIQPSFENPSEFFRVNTYGTQKVCEWVKKWNIKLIYSGSSSQWHNPYQSPYAMFKKLGEDVCKMYKKVYKTNIEIARFYNVYGENEIIEGNWAAVIGKWRGQIFKKMPITIVGDGEQKRDFTHIDDIVDALIKIGFSIETEEDAWELGTGLNYSLNQVANMFIEKFNCKIVYIDNQKGNYNETIRVNNKAIDKLGWQPKDRLKEYINNLTESIKTPPCSGHAYENE